jgi:uncharacterized DUF497 family protein
MRFICDADKADKLLKEHNIDIEIVVDIILNRGPASVIKNPVREGQQMFIINYNGYIHCVPFIRDADGNYILKTAYKSRKYNKIYGEHSET